MIHDDAPVRPGNANSEEFRLARNTTINARNQSCPCADWCASQWSDDPCNCEPHDRASTCDCPPELRHRGARGLYSTVTLCGLPTVDGDRIVADITLAPTRVTCPECKAAP